MTDFIVMGHSGSYNRGCEAILRCTVNILRDKVSDARFRVVSMNPQTDEKPFQEYIESGLMKFAPRRAAFLKPMSIAWLKDGVHRRLVPGFPSHLTFANRGFIEGGQVAISIGGDLFTDDYWDPTPWVRDLEYLKRRGMRTVIWAASIGPFHDEKIKHFCADHMSRVDLITVREGETQAYLESLGLTENVCRVADPAFLLQPVPVHDLPFLPTENPRVVGLGVSALATGAHLDSDKYINAFVELANRLLDDPSTWVILMPHVTGNPSQAGDDESVCSAVRRELNHQDRVYLPPLSYGAQQMKYIISKCDYFVGSRTHTTIAAFSSCVPTISVGSTQKVYGLNHTLFGHVDYVLPVDNVNTTSLAEAFDSLVGSAADARNALARALPAQQALARYGGDALVERLGSAS